jgi:hypothetical protein
MATHVTYPAEGISRLVIDEMARDAQIRGLPDLTDILVTPAWAKPESGSQFSVDGDRLRYQGGPVARLLLPRQVSVEVGSVGGELHVHGLSGDLEVGAVHGDLRLRELSGRVRLERVDGSLRADGVAHLQLLGSCDGDMRFSDGGTLEAETVAGDLRLYGVEGAGVEQVHGDFWAEKVRGELRVSQIDGDARLDDIAGAALIQAVGGDLRTSALAGGLSAPAVNGDAQLHGGFGAEESYVLSADGDVVLRLPADADFKLNVRANGRVRSEVQLTPSPDGAPVFTAVLGRGSGRLSITGGGDVRISQAGSEGRPGVASGNWNDLGERIRQQVTASLAAAGIKPGTGELNGAPFGAGRGPKSSRNRPPEPPPPPRAGAGAAGAARQASGPQGPTSEEQLVILKMVEAGTISAEEAEILLKALGPER